MERNPCRIDDSPTGESLTWANIQLWANGVFAVLVVLVAVSFPFSADSRKLATQEHPVLSGVPDWLNILFYILIYLAIAAVFAFFSIRGLSKGDRLTGALESSTEPMSQKGPVVEPAPAPRRPPTRVRPSAPDSDTQEVKRPKPALRASQQSEGEPIYSEGLRAWCDRNGKVVTVFAAVLGAIYTITQLVTFLSDR